MQDAELNRLLDPIKDFADPRRERNQDQPFMSIIFIAVCGAIRETGNWVEIQVYGNAKVDWLKTMIALPHSIPPHDTSDRLLQRLKR